MAGPPLDENGEKIPPWRLSQNWYVAYCRLAFVVADHSLAGTRPRRREVTSTAADLLLLNLSTRRTLDRALATPTSVLPLLDVRPLSPRCFEVTADVRRS